MTEARKYLSDKGIHFSQQRIAIMDYLLKNRTHPTADEIFWALSPSMPTLSRTTVYNTLRLFLESGAIQVIKIDEKNVRFDADTSMHGHFLCDKCGAIHDVPLSEGADPIVLDNPHLCDFEVNSIHIYYHGTCPQCLKNHINNI